jgi:hypothetical protein
MGTVATMCSGVAGPCPCRTRGLVRRRRELRPAVPGSGALNVAEVWDAARVAFVDTGVLSAVPAGCGPSVGVSGAALLQEKGGAATPVSGAVSLLASGVRSAVTAARVQSLLARGVVTTPLSGAVPLLANGVRSAVTTARVQSLLARGVAATPVSEAVPLLANGVRSTVSAARVQSLLARGVALSVWDKGVPLGVNDLDVGGLAEPVDDLRPSVGLGVLVWSKPLADSEDVTLPVFCAPSICMQHCQRSLRDPKGPLLGQRKNDMETYQCDVPHGVKNWSGTTTSLGVRGYSGSSS